MFNPAAPYDDKETQRQFERDLLPLLERHGSEIGDKAMQGDLLAENVIRRYTIFRTWLDPVNLALLQKQLLQWLRLKEH